MQTTVKTVAPVKIKEDFNKSIIYHESRIITDYGIINEGSKKYLQVDTKHATLNVFENWLFPLANLIESIEADRGEEMYKAIGEFEDEQELQEKFLEHYWDELHVEEKDLQRLLCEDLCHYQINQYEFCGLDSESQKSYMEICDAQGSSVSPDWYKNSIMLIREAKNAVSPECWATMLAHA